MPSSEVASAKGPLSPMAHARRLEVPQSTAIHLMSISSPPAYADFGAFRREGQLPQ